MAKALLSMILGQLDGLFIPEEIKQHVGLAVDLEEEIHKLTSNFEAIQAVLEDAERRQVKDASVRYWLCKLKSISYDVEDVLDEWNTAKFKSELQKQERAAEHAPLLKKLCYSLSFSSTQIMLHHNIAVKIKELNDRLDFVAAEKDRYKFELGRGVHEEPEHRITTSFIDVTEVYGRDQEKNAVLKILLEENNEKASKVQIISILGMGGIGKTTLARLVYNDNAVDNHFDKKMWASVSDPFDDIKIAKGILEALGDATNFVELQTLLHQIRKAIVGKKFLLVLDDVWNEDDRKWEPFKETLSCGSLGSKILMTTRKKNVAVIMGCTTLFPLGKLPKEECWLLFSRIAFYGRTSRECRILEDCGRKIAAKCQGMPLAVKTIGGLMRFKRTIEQWQSVLNSEIWELKEAERGIFPPLLLSYYDLAPALRQCFSYCAIFPKDYVIEKDRLIKLWMAQGFLKEKQSKDMEILGQDYFEDLAICSFFQNLERDDDGNIIKCKMHDIVHDFSQFLTKDECFMVEASGVGQSKVDTYSEKGHHLMLVLGEKVTFPTYLYSIKQLRTLLVEPSNFYGSIMSESLPKLFNQLTCLRTLDLSMKYHTTFGSSITEIPKEIENLIHLRYLNMSNNGDLEELPDALCELYNLQTLDLSFCKKLKRLPNGIGKLVNLRHLKNYGTWRVRSMPKGMEKLTCLRTLREFALGEGGSNCETSSIGKLGSLNHLRDYLEIRGLGNVRDVNEAKEAKLQSKECLLNLLLKFDMDEENAEGRIPHGDALVLEALQPPPYLECLEIHNYRGPSILPSWMLALTNLRHLAVCSCRNWERLPPLGKLPFLESLWIYDMRRVKKVGVEFLGLERDEEQPSSSSSIIPFPNLKRLEIHDMNDLEEWEYGVIPFLGKRKEQTTIMPCLNFLLINRCPRLKSLPHHLQNSSIETLEIRWCPILESGFNISGIPNIRINYMDVKRDRV
ncbi:putative disease resistance protein RGA3 [Durio zibethinus]|uniref:Disease resistance protein RGA3 n=1 Tax=Durio zibethinus TaxID=66656 RepID=A0A6P5XQI5_DURZI|nr:putative disease resistance protein RGA3 [Durio zibethinus]